MNTFFWLHKCYHCGRFIISDETDREDCTCAPARLMKAVGVGFFPDIDAAQQFVISKGLADDLGEISQAYIKKNMPLEQPMTPEREAYDRLLRLGQEIILPPSKH